MPHERGRTLRLVLDAPSSVPPDDEAVVVLDSTWTAAGEVATTDRVLGIRGVGGRLLETRDLIAETTQRLDAWAAASDIVDRLVVEGVSMWFYMRLSVWVWFQQRIVWVALLDDVVTRTRPERIVCSAAADEVIVEAARLVAARDGLGFELDGGPSPAAGSMAAATPSAAAAGVHGAAATPAARSAGPLARLARVARRGFGRDARGGRGRPATSAGPWGDAAEARRAMADRFETLSRERGRLIVVLEHARQRVETADGPRDVNPYLSAIVDALAGTALNPIGIELKADLDDPVWWERLQAPDGRRSVRWIDVARAGDAETGSPDPEPPEAWVDAVRQIATPVPVHGVDLGPALVDRVAGLAGRQLPIKVRAVRNIRALLRRTRPAGILLADEYHRQDWLAAARAEGVPVAAVQHGMIYAGHNGYVHRDRPASLALPDRTYVFGSWERDVLVERSVYRPDEVVVSGSPRLDLVEAVPGPEAPGIRAELGVRPGDRLVVLSGTYGPAYRRFHIPYALDRLLDRPWPGVHLVVKQHPGEKDRGPYEALMQGLAAARGFAPPPVTVVQHIDLYRLLRSADAHLGIHSTVLTEAVAAGTHNLLADTLASSDLLGYVADGVALPVRDGGEFLAALDAREGITADARSAFLARHFREGSASGRVRDDLLSWLAR